MVILNSLIHPDFENFDSALEEALSVVRVTHIAYRLEQKQAVIYYSIVEMRCIIWPYLSVFGWSEGNLEE